MVGLTMPTVAMVHRGHSCHSPCPHAVAEVSIVCLLGVAVVESETKEISASRAYESNSPAHDGVFPEIEVVRCF